MSFRIAVGIAASGSDLGLDVQDDVRARRSGTSLVRVGILDMEVANLRLHPADLVGLHHQLAEGGLLDRSHHHHAVAERELAVENGTLVIFDDAMRLKAKRIAQPRDGGWNVTVAHGRYDRCAS